MSNGRAPKKHVRVHDGLVGARALVGTPYLRDPRLRAEYAAEIAPRTAVMLNRIFDLHLVGVTPQRVLDLGAGTGVVGTTLRSRFGESLAVTSVDRVGAPGIVAADLSRPVCPPGVSGRFDFIVAAHLLNEFRSLDAAARAQLVLFWMKTWLAPGGHLVLIEPALRETGRALLEVREHVLAAGAFVKAPCLTQAPCPALVNPRDWCHDSAPRPGLPRADFSFLLLAAEGQAPRDGDLLRVVSDLKREKGRQRVFGCGLQGRQPYVLQSRDVSVTNEAFLRLERGVLCRIQGTLSSGDGLRLDAQSQVERVGPPASARS